jgi:hypothetical protein
MAEANREHSFTTVAYVDWARFPGETSDRVPTSNRHLSCERCKHRKSRCNRQSPTCSSCAQAGVACHYRARKKPGFPAGHRHGLEGKIGMLMIAGSMLKKLTRHF